VVWGHPESATSVEIRNIAAQLLRRKDSLAGKPLSLIV